MCFIVIKTLLHSASGQKVHKVLKNKESLLCHWLGWVKIHHNDNVCPELLAVAVQLHSIWCGAKSAALIHKFSEKQKKKCFNCVTGSSLQVKSSQTQEWEVALGALAYSISSICCQMLIKVLHRCAFLSPTDWSTSGTVRLNEPKSKQERWCDGDVTKARYVSIFWQVNKTSKCILMLGTSTTTVDNPHTHSTTIMLGLWCYMQQRLPP